MKDKRIDLNKLLNSMYLSYYIIGLESNYAVKPAPIDTASRNCISFYSEVSKEAREFILKSKAGIVICSNKLQFSEEIITDKTIVQVDNPRLAFIRIMAKLCFGEFSF